MFRACFPAVLLSLTAICGFAVSVLADEEKSADGAKSLRFYIGTYTWEDKSQGIYLSTLDLATGALSPAKVAAKTPNPSFLAIHPSGKFLYAVGEINDFAGKKTGAVTAFAIQGDGTLKQLNQQSSGGTGPCHLVVDTAGKNLLVANYGGGSVASLPIAEDGKLKEAASVMQHRGSSVNEQRQRGPHAHSINLDPANRFAVAADLGLDQLLVYKFDPQTGKLAPNDPPYASVQPGAGPRHFAFHPTGRFAYVINEMDMTVNAFRYEAEKGVLTTQQSISTLPEGTEHDPRFSTAEVVVHPGGKFLYGSNRHYDSIVAYRIDENTGKLTYVENEPTQGKYPRNFVVDPTGKYLLAENQGSDNIVVFSIDQKTGELSATGHKLEVPIPVCVRFFVGE